MNLQEQINADLKAAMLNRDVEVRDLLRVVIGEFNREGKIVPNDKVLSIVKKMIDNGQIIGNLNEIEILKKYLPEQLSEEKLNSLITALIFNNNYTIKDIGKIMGVLKSNYSGQYDGKVASAMIKEKLN